MNNTKKMPDAYAKHTESNLYKLLQVVNLLQNDAKVDLKCIDKSRDIYKSSGKTLDRYGEMVGELRSGATDEQYRTKILSKIARSISGSDCNSVISAVAQIFGVDASDISLSEGDMSVAINGLTIEMLENSGYKSREIEKMISGLIPAGVELSHQKYKGTLLINDETSSSSDYPTLYVAWSRGMSAYVANGTDIGLSGYGEVPWDSTGTMSGTYQGGTLGILSGEDE